jgi:serine/threonine-protein kinase RsbW
MPSSGSNGRVRRAKPSALRWTIPSDFGEGRMVQKEILAAVEEHSYSKDDTFAIKLALEEALINAIKHGNKLDPKKHVKIEASVTPKQAEIVIEDEGPGFDRKAVPDPTLDENIEKCSGRGILLMESYMNCVEWTKGGRRVRLVKKKESK